jgi:cytoplasmic iron level regulating protein YaaA (DUF328/UPF0246 family)
VFGPALREHRAAVAAALRDANGGDARLLGVSGDHLDRARDANRSVEGAPTAPAWQRFTGVVWDHLDPATLPAARRRDLVVVLALAGLVRGDDPVPDHRLKLNVRLDPLGVLARFWRPVVSEELHRVARRRLVVDLLPNEHRAAVDLDGVRSVTVTLRERDGASGGHAAKAAKGRLARHLLTSEAHPLDALAAWQDDRFVLELTE